VYDNLAVLDAVGLSRVQLLGFSMSGAITGAK
jgi:hypothetical protein